MYSAVQYSTVQYSTVQYSTVQYSTVQYSTVQYSTVQYSTVQYSTVQYSTIQYSTPTAPHFASYFLLKILSSLKNLRKDRSTEGFSVTEARSLSCPRLTWNLILKVGFLKLSEKVPEVSLDFCLLFCFFRPGTVLTVGSGISGIPGMSFFSVITRLAAGLPVTLVSSRFW